MYNSIIITYTATKGNYLLPIILNTQDLSKTALHSWNTDNQSGIAAA
jgi:hypothetical protein